MSGPEDPEDGGGLERHLRTYVEDSTLWPVLIVLVVSLAVLGAALLLLAWEAGNPFAILALVLLAATSVEGVVRSVRRRRRLGTGSVLVLLLWGLAGLVALAAASSGMFDPPRVR